MSPSLRWRLAIPLIGLSALPLFGAAAGIWLNWAEYGVTFRLLNILVCLILVATVCVAVSIGVRPTRDVPWLRVGLVALGLLLGCGLTFLADAVATSPASLI